MNRPEGEPVKITLVAISETAAHRMVRRLQRADPYLAFGGPYRTDAGLWVVKGTGFIAPRDLVKAG